VHRSRPPVWRRLKLGGHDMDAAARLSAGRVGQAGQGLVEYAIILSLIAGLAIGVAFFVGGRMKGELSTVGGSVAAAVSHGGNTGGDKGHH